MPTDLLPLPASEYTTPPALMHLCTAMEQLPGIHVLERGRHVSTDQIMVWFEVFDWTVRGMVTLARCTCPRYYGDVHPILFLLQMTAGDYTKVDRLREVILQHLLDQTEGYNILLEH